MEKIFRRILPLFIRKFFAVMATFTLMLTIVGPAATYAAPVDLGGLSQSPYFTLTSAGSVVEMTAGETLEFTVKSYNGDQTPNALTGDDYVYIEVMDNNWGSDGVDITEVGPGLSLKEVTTPWGETVEADVDGTSDTMIAVNIASGASDDNTFTVKATSNFNVFVWNETATINDDTATLAGQDFQNIIVNSAVDGGDHLLGILSSSTVEAGSSATLTLNVVNQGGGFVASTVSDLMLMLNGVAVDGLTIYSSSGSPAVLTEVPLNGLVPGFSTNITPVTLTNGTGTFVISNDTAGDVSISFTDMSLPEMSPSQPVTLTVTAAQDFTLEGYGPPGGQIGVPTMAPVDFFFSHDVTTRPGGSGLIFPLANTDSSIFSIIDDQGAAVTGNWHQFEDTWGASTQYMVTFNPDEPFAANTEHTASVSTALVRTLSQNLSEDENFSTSGGRHSFSFTTGSGGGEFFGSGGGGGEGGTFFGGDMGGKVPPMAMLNYPMPHSWDVPTNIGCVTVDFDRPMDSSTLVDDNIYLRKMVSGSETVPTGTQTVTILGNEDRSVCISNSADFDSDSEYRVVVTRDVKSPNGTPIAGMPIDESGNAVLGFGFGFENMGPFQESFHTGSSTFSTIAPEAIGSNLDRYSNAAGSIVGVPTSVSPRVTFNSPLSPSTVTSTNVTLKRNGSVPVAGNVNYDSSSNAIKFVPSAALAASTSYTFAISAGVKAIDGTTAVTAVSRTFTTGAADSTDPQLTWMNADNYGFSINFDEPMAEATVENRANYTVKTCSQAGISADGTSCNGGGAVTNVSLQSGVNANYESDMYEVWFDGLTLTPNDGIYVGLSANVTDVAGNPIDTSYDSWTMKVMDGSSFAGGQGMMNMGNMGFEDFDMGLMGEKPIGVWPMNTMAGSATKYFIDIPLSKQIEANGFIELTFPEGMNISGAKPDGGSPINSDFNGPMSGDITFTSSLSTYLTNGPKASPAGLGFTPSETVSIYGNDGQTANAVVGYKSGARKVVIQLSGATQVSGNDMLSIDLDGIVNPSEAKDFDTPGYTATIKTFDSDGDLLEAMTSMPFYISPSGDGTVMGAVSAGENGLNGVTVYLDSPMTGPMQVDTSNNGYGGMADGEYMFSNLPIGDYMIWTDPSITIGDTTYKGQDWSEPIWLSGVEMKNFTLTVLDGTTSATQPVSLTYSTLPTTNLGFNDSIDIFAGGPNGFVMKSVSRTQLEASGSPYTTNLFLPSSGDWMVGIGPSLPNGPMMKMPKIDWMPAPSVNVNVDSSDLAGDDLDSVEFAISSADKSIQGKVVDGSGTAIANAEIFGYSPRGGIGNNTVSKSDGTFSLPVVSGSYKVGAFLPGMPNSQEVSALVDSSGDVYVRGSTTASTGSSGVNPFLLKIAKPDLTISGSVSDGDSAISGAPVWAYRTDAPSPPINTMTNESGIYTLYVNAGVWMVEADAPGWGYLGSKSLTLTDTSLSGQDFFPNSGEMVTVTGTVDNPSSDDDSGANVFAWGPAGSNQAMTNSSGEFSMKLPAGSSYTADGFIPGVGELAPITIDLSAASGGDTDAGNDFTVAIPYSFTVSLSEALNEGAFIDFFSTNGKGNGAFIPEGKSRASTQLPAGDYYFDLFVPGVPFESLIIAGADYDSELGTITIDGTGDDITITLPTLYTVTGQVTYSGNGQNQSFVNVVDSTTNKHFGVMTQNNVAGGGQDGEYVIKLPAGSYSMGANKPGYSSTYTNLTVEADSSGNDFALTRNDKTISGTVSAGGTGISNAHVWAVKSGGGFDAVNTDTDGTYTLSVGSGSWSVYAVSEGYNKSSAVTADTTSGNVSNTDFALTELSTALNGQKASSITPSAGGQLNDPNTGTRIVVPPNALGTGNDQGQITTQETNSVSDTATATPIGNGQNVNAYDANNTPQTTLDDEIEITLKKTAAQLDTLDIDTKEEVEKLSNAYWDNTVDNWVDVPTSVTYYDSNDAVVPPSTVGGAADLTTAGVSYITLTSATDHLTKFAAVNPAVVASSNDDSNDPAPSVNNANTGGGGGGGGGAISSSNTSTVKVDTVDSLSAKVMEDVVNVSATGVIEEEISLQNKDTKAYVTIAENTAVTLADGSKYTGELPVPAPTTSDVAAPDGSKYASSVYELGIVGEDLTFSKNVTVVLPINSNVALDANLAVYTLKDVEVVVEAEEGAEVDPEVEPQTTTEKQWVKVSDVVVKKLDSKYVVEFETNHFSQYVVMRDLEVTVTAVENEAPANTSFTDTKGHWAAGYVEDLYKKGIVSGYSTTMFGPDQNITRAEFTKIAVSAFGIPTVSASEITFMPFKDVPLAEWFAPYVQAAYIWNVVEGYSDSTFRPNDPINRAEAMKILLDAAKVELGTPASAGFPDVAKSAWFAPYVNYAAANGVVGGYANGDFGPGDNVTRGQVSKMVSLMMDMVGDEEESIAGWIREMAT